MLVPELQFVYAYYTALTPLYLINIVGYKYRIMHSHAHVQSLSLLVINPSVLNVRADDLCGRTSA